MTIMPISLSQALATFDDIWSPRIVGRVNNYDVKVVHTTGEHVVDSTTGRDISG
jgi:hypothetical protein